MNWPLPLITFNDIPKWLIHNKNNLKLPKYKNSYWFKNSAESIAIICLKKKEEISREVNILLPAYFCNQSIRFLRNINVKLLFYALKEDLTPDYEYISKTFSGKKIDIFLHVNFFGKIVGNKKSKEFANDIGATLIEDCAHIMSPFQSNKFYGDYIIFSPHKFFAIPTISLVLTNCSLNFYKIRSFESVPYIWLFKQLIKIIFKINYRNRDYKETKPIKENLNFVSPNLITINVAKNYLSDFKFASEKRIANANLLKERFKKNNLYDQVINFEKGCVPYLFGIKFHNKKVADRMYNSLTKNEYLVMRWPDLPFEINEINNHLQKRCLDRVSQTLFFFVHQNLKKHDWMKKIDKILEENNLIK